jgi:hypothetical protein
MSESTEVALLRRLVEWRGEVIANTASEGAFNEICKDARQCLAAHDAKNAAAHTDHPMRHFDRTCPACIAESAAPDYDESTIKAREHLSAAPATPAPVATATTMDVMVQRFLGWPVPFSVCADLCATRQEQGRSGTNLLSAIEAREMLTYVTDAKVATPATPAPAVVSVPRECLTSAYLDLAAICPNPSDDRPDFDTCLGKNNSADAKCLTRAYLTLRAMLAAAPTAAAPAVVVESCRFCTTPAQYAEHHKAAPTATGTAHRPNYPQDYFDTLDPPQD